MVATEEELTAAYIVWLGNQTNRTFDADDLPADIEHILLPYLIRTHGSDRAAVVQSAGGLSITRATTDLPADMLRIIRPYRRPRFA
jgi:hypothetical protein